jgi:hypothetical protein
VPILKRYTGGAPTVGTTGIVGNRKLAADRPSS